MGRRRRRDQAGFCTFCGKASDPILEPPDPFHPPVQCSCVMGSNYRFEFRERRQHRHEDDEVDPEEHPTSGWRQNGHRAQYSFAKDVLDPTETQDLLASFGPTIATLIRHRVFFRETIEQAAKAANVSKSTAERMLTEALTLLRVSLM